MLFHLLLDQASGAGDCYCKELTGGCQQSSFLSTDQPLNTLSVTRAMPPAALKGLEGQGGCPERGRRHGHLHARHAAAWNLLESSMADLEQILPRRDFDDRWAVQHRREFQRICQAHIAQSGQTSPRFTPFPSGTPTRASFTQITDLTSGKLFDGSHDLASAFRDVKGYN